MAGSPVRTATLGRLALRLVASGLVLSLSAATAAPPASGTDTVQPRYAVNGERLERNSALDSADGRYLVDPRLQRMPDRGQRYGGLVLDAKVAAAATACAGVDAIFANGFE